MLARFNQFHGQKKRYQNIRWARPDSHFITDFIKRPGTFIQKSEKIKVGDRTYQQI